MIDIYNITLIIHLLSAIIFVGFLFTDVVFFSVLKNKYSKEEFNNIKNFMISKRAIRIMPFIIILLLLSGGHMAIYHIDNLNIFFIIKLSLALLIFIGVIYSLIMKFIVKKPSAKFMKKFHTYALVMSFIIIICAKLMLNY